MFFGWMRALGVLALAPAAALAFEVVDTLPFPSRGGFPEAYPRDPTYPTTLWAQAGLMYDSNAFRLSDTTNARAVLGKPERWDTVMRYGLGAGHTQRIFGRQSIALSARGEYFDYMRYSKLDHFAYGLGVDWLFEVTNDLTGRVGYARTQALADPAEVQRPIKDEVTSNRLFIDAAYRLGPTVRLRGGASEDRGHREGDRATRNTHVTTVFAGVDYVTGLRNSIGVEARRSEGSAPLSEILDPTGQFATNEYEEHELAAVAVYNLGAQLSVVGRLGRTKRHYTEAPIEDFEGTTGRGTVRWQPAPKLSLVFDAYRELRPVLEIDATHMEVRGARFGPAWAPTLKLVFTAQFINEHRRFSQSEGAALIPRDDTVRIWRFGAGWEPRRHFTVGSGLEWGERESNTLGRDLDYLAVMANLRYDW